MVLRICILIPPYKFLKDLGKGWLLTTKYGDYNNKFVIVIKKKHQESGEREANVALYCPKVCTVHFHS